MATGAQAHTMMMAPTNDKLSQLNGTIHENQNPNLKNYSNGNNPNPANHQNGNNNNNNNSKTDQMTLPTSDLTMQDSHSNPFEHNDSDNDNDTTNNKSTQNGTKPKKKKKNSNSTNNESKNNQENDTKIANNSISNNKNNINTKTETNTDKIIAALINGDIEEEKHNNNNNKNKKKRGNKNKTKNKRKQKRLSERKDNNTLLKLNNNASNFTADIDKAIQSLLSCSLKLSHRKQGILAGYLVLDDITSICLQAKKIVYTQPMLLEVDCPVNIVGDVHGQYPDLIHLFELAGLPPESNYLFLGDYVDRGSYSLEVIVLLLSYKIKYKDHFFLLRGNHECASINRLYGFFHECKQRFPHTGAKLWRRFTDVFNCLPVAAIIDEKIFCMHGGLSPSCKHMDDIRKLQRPTDVPDSGLLCDLLWADPEPAVLGWGVNDRGVSYTFGSDVLARFLTVHDMDLVCRAHQVVEDGYEFFGSRSLVTIFSAPNYCGEFDNAGAIMAVDDSLMCSFHILKPKPLKRTRFY